MLHRRFEEVVLPHLDAAFNYARWLTGSEADAEDMVQDAVRALRVPSLRSSNARAWLLTIVRRTSYGRIPSRERARQSAVFDEVRHLPPVEGLDPEAWPVQTQTVDTVRSALEQLPVEFR